jgi:hypothetical protein
MWLLDQATLGGRQCPHRVTWPWPRGADSVGRPQQSQLAGRTQLITLPPRTGCSALSCWPL